MLFNPILKVDSSIDPRAYVSENSKIGKNVSIEPGAVSKTVRKLAMDVKSVQTLTGKCYFGKQSEICHVSIYLVRILAKM